MCHYRSPIISAEMLEVIADISEEIDVPHDSLCYSEQIDGSMDKQRQDCKEGKKCGAEGLFDSLCIPKAVLDDISADGESANTGRKIRGGLWELLVEKLQKKLIVVYVIGLIGLYIAVFSKLKYWIVDVKAVSHLFRASAIRILKSCIR